MGPSMGTDSADSPTDPGTDDPGTDAPSTDETDVATTDDEDDGAPMPGDGGLGCTGDDCLPCFDLLESNVCSASGCCATPRPILLRRPCRWRRERLELRWRRLRRLRVRASVRSVSRSHGSQLRRCRFVRVARQHHWVRRGSVQRGERLRDAALCGWRLWGIAGGRRVHARHRLHDAALRRKPLQRLLERDLHRSPIAKLALPGGCE